MRAGSTFVLVVFSVNYGTEEEEPRGHGLRCPPFFRLRFGGNKRWPVPLVLSLAKKCSSLNCIGSCESTSLRGHLNVIVGL